MRAAILQSDGAGLTPDYRLEKLANAIAEQQQRAKTDLIVCPELFLCGYNAGADIQKYAEESDGPLAEKIAALARRENIAIVYGYSEREGGQLYNAANCISADGERLATHRKLLLPPGFEADYFQCGEQATLFDLCGLRCGLLICYDVEYPESVRALAHAGAQLIIVPTGLFAQWGVVARHLIPTRAFENGVWVVYANHAGEENGTTYLGESCIIAPDGSEAARAGGSEETVSALIDAGSVTQAQNRLPYLQHFESVQKKLANQNQ